MTKPDLAAARGTVAPPLADADTWVWRYRQFALALALAAAFASGFVESVAFQMQLVAIMTFASAVSIWCGLDARVHGKLFLRSFAWLMLFTWPLGVLVHLVWTRRWRGCLTYLALGVAAAAAGIAGAGVGAAVVNG